MYLTVCKTIIFTQIYGLFFEWKPHFNFWWKILNFKPRTCQYWQVSLMDRKLSVSGSCWKVKVLFAFVLLKFSIISLRVLFILLFIWNIRIKGFEIQIQIELGKLCYYFNYQFEKERLIFDSFFLHMLLMLSSNEKFELIITHKSSCLFSSSVLFPLIFTLVVIFPVNKRWHLLTPV